MKTRGMGSLYRRGKTWWVQYSFRGRLYRESSRSQVRAVAVRLLRMRQAEMARGRLAAPDAEKVTFDDLVELIRADTSRSRTGRGTASSTRSSTSAPRSPACQR